VEQYIKSQTEPAKPEEDSESQSLIGKKGMGDLFRKDDQGKLL